MLAVRCDACGMKALVAASQCPHCGHLLDIRDSFGELLPMVHCTTCDASYLRRDGSCRWCGSTPDPVNYRPYIWKGVGAFAFVAMAVGAWFTRDVEEPQARAVIATGSLAASTESLVATPPAEPEPIPVDSPSVALTVSSDSLVAPDSVPAADALPSVEATPPSVAPPERATTLAPVAVPDSAPPIAAAPMRPSAPRAAAPVKSAVRKPPPRRAARWTSAVVVSWVTVRAAPSRSARLVGSVGPDSRVQLGEVRGDWRHIRMRGIAGWVKDGRFAAPRRVASKRRAAP